MPAEAALPLIGKIAPILTTLSSADAPAVNASVKAAADTRPKTVLSLIPSSLPRRCIDLLAQTALRAQTTRQRSSFGTSITWRPQGGKLRALGIAPNKASAPATGACSEPFRATAL